VVLADADADAEVVDAAAVAQGEFAELVDGVVADSEVLGGVVGGPRSRAESRSGAEPFVVVSCPRSSGVCGTPPLGRRHDFPPSTHR
jgi:hypothetical protein